MSTLTDLLPLPNATFHILLALLEGERHGYFIKREIHQRTGGQLKLGSGAAEHLDDERRRYYRITDFGRACAEAEANRLQDLAQSALLKLGRKPAETAG
jgi:DNA-binding PadR family transcriptional regulator